MLTFEEWAQQNNKAMTPDTQAEYNQYVNMYNAQNSGGYVAGNMSNPGGYHDPNDERRRPMGTGNPLRDYLSSQGINFDYSGGGSWGDIYQGLGGSSAMDEYNIIQQDYAQNLLDSRRSGSQSLLGLTGGQGLSSGSGFGAQNFSQQQAFGAGNLNYQNQLFGMGQARKSGETSFFNSLVDDLSDLYTSDTNPPDWTYTVT